MMRSAAQVDLVGEENTGKLPDSVRLLAMQVEQVRKRELFV